jgi:hypothetical protein
VLDRGDRVVGVGRSRWAVHDEPVDLGIALDQGRVGVDELVHDRSHAPASGLGQPRQEVAEDVLADPVDHSVIEAHAVAEIAVEHRLAGAGHGGHVVEGDTGPVAADGPQCRLDEGAATPDPVGVPAAARRLVHVRRYRVLRYLHCR